MEATKPLLKTGNRYLYNLMNVMTHFLGERLSRPFSQRILRRIESDLREVMECRPQGRLLPVDRRTDLSSQEFRSQYARKCPVVFAGAAKDWPCTGKWTHDNFARMYGSDEVLIFNASKNQEGKLEYTFARLEDAIARMKTEKEVNVRFNPLMYHHPELKADVDWGWYQERISKSLPGTEQMQLFIGGNDSSTHIHTAISENLFLQAEGHKKWVMFHPAYNPVIQPLIDRTPYFLSELDYENPDPEKHPYFSKAIGFECVLKPGDILYNPCFYWHFVTSLTPSVSFGYRWVDPLSIWKLEPVLGLLTLCSFNPPIWNFARDKADFTKIVTHKRNSRAMEKR